MKGHIRRDSRNGSYVLVVDIGPDPVTGSRRQRSRSFRTRREAERERNSLLKAIDDGQFVEPSRMPLTEYLDGWLAGVKLSIRPTTYLSYQYAITHVSARLGHVPLRNLRKADIDGLLNELMQSGRRGKKDEGLSSRTVRYVHGILKRSLEDAVRTGMLQANPARFVEPPRRARPTLQAWSADDARRFLVHIADERLAIAFRLTLVLGLRRGELLGLRWADVDLAERRLTITSTRVMVGGQVAVSEPKTSRGRRTLPLDEATVATLQRWKSTQLRERLEWGPASKPSDYLITREDGGLVDPAALSKEFARIIAKAAVPRIRFHDLRHTNATLLILAGVPAKVVSERLGHATVAFTLDTYAHVLPGMQEQATETLAQVLAGAG